MTFIKDTIQNKPFVYSNKLNLEFIYFFGFTIIIICIFIFLFKYYININYKKIENIPYIKNVSKIKDHITCKKHNGTMINGNCICTYPFTGYYCESQFYDNNYNQIKANYTSISKTNTKYLSFGDNACTDLCDNTDDCEGVYFYNNNCELAKDISPSLNGKNIFSKTIDYTFNNAFLFRTSTLPDNFWNIGISVVNTPILLNDVPVSYYMSSGKLTFYTNPDKSDAQTFTTPGFNQITVNKKYAVYSTV